MYDCFEMPPFQESNPKADIVRLLIDHGADTGVQDEADLTPLHLAAFNGNVEIVRLLIQYGADVTAPDRNKVTPLHSASSTVSSKTSSL
jgi:ankyrin repeat protein